MLTLRKGKFIKIIAILLACSFLLQQSAWATVTDLREGGISPTNVLLAIVSGAVQGASANPNWSVARTFVTTYLVPMAINQVAKHIDNPVLRAAFSTGASVGANMALDKFGGSTLGSGDKKPPVSTKKPPKSGVLAKLGRVVTKGPGALIKGSTETANQASKSLMQTIFSRLGLDKFFARITGKLHAVLNKITGRGKGPGTPSPVTPSSTGPGASSTTTTPATPAQPVPEAATAIVKKVREQPVELIPAKLGTDIVQHATTAGMTGPSTLVAAGVNQLPFWQAILIKSTQAAVYAAVEQAVYQNLNDSHRQLAQMISSASGLLVGELVGVGLEKLAGGRFTIDDKGKIIAEKISDGTLNQELNKELRKFFADFGIAMAGRGVEVLFAELGVEEEGILGSAGVTSLLQQARQKSALKDELKAIESKKEAAEGKREELRQELGKRTREYYAKVEGQVDRSTREALYADRGMQQLVAEIKALDKRIDSFNYEISEANKGYTKALSEGLLRGGISVGLQKISLATPSPVHGAYFNLMSASIVEAALSKRPFREVLSENVNKVTADVFSMGRATPSVNEKGQMELVFKNPNDIFFIARYSDYIRSVAEEDGEITWPLEQQLISSLHYQTVNIVQDTLRHLAYEAGVAQTSPWVRDIYRAPGKQPIVVDVRVADIIIGHDLYGNPAISSPPVKLIESKLPTEIVAHPVGPVPEIPIHMPPIELDPLEMVLPPSGIPIKMDTHLDPGKISPPPVAEPTPAKVPPAKSLTVEEIPVPPPSQTFAPIDKINRPPAEEKLTPVNISHDPFAVDWESILKANAPSQSKKLEVEEIYSDKVIPDQSKPLKVEMVWPDTEKPKKQK